MSFEIVLFRIVAQPLEQSFLSQLEDLGLYQPSNAL